MLGRNGNIAYVRYDHQGRIVPGGPIIQAKPPRVGNWQAVSNVIGTNVTGTNGNVLRAFVRIDYFNRVVPSSLLLLNKEPGDNNSQTTWVEISAQYRGNGITTTTTTSTSSTSTSTTTTSTTLSPTTFFGGAFETTNSVDSCGGFRYPFSTTATLNPEATSFCNATYVDADFSQLTPQFYDGWGGVFRVNGVSFKRLGYFANGMTRFILAETSYYPCTPISC